MCGTEVRTELPLAATELSGCSCCTPGARTQTPTPVEGSEYWVEGLSCGHCVQTVEKAVNAVAGVESATVDLAAGAKSRLTVTGEVAATAVRDAVTGAGYSLAANN
ncbi:heavy-metal-associated domain-containing protein [Arthrobacter sp. H16F315]|uniref:heavy-metal-associated domain-containing protein n=1 Tax=Arthrobacter sp. H16F315 TaxID=2955314 RepID=UPI002097345A|nr:cation transporter [Arthrobacter sp. H16F315]MDD1478585.1 cation transporter [Arthrobacter sp. H16F315]